MPQDGKRHRKGRAVEIPQSAPPVRTRLNLSAQQREILGEWVAETATPDPDVQPERPHKTHPMASRHRPAAPVDAERPSDVPVAAEGPVLGPEEPEETVVYKSPPDAQSPGGSPAAEPPLQAALERTPTLRVDSGSTPECPDDAARDNPQRKEKQRAAPASVPMAAAEGDKLMRDARRSASLMADPARHRIGSTSDAPPVSEPKARWEEVISADGRTIRRTYVPAGTQDYAEAAMQPPPHLGAAERAAYQVAVRQGESPETLDVRTQQRILQQANATRAAPMRKAEQRPAPWTSSPRTHTTRPPAPPPTFRPDVVSETAGSVGDLYHPVGPHPGYPYPHWQMHQWAGYPPAYADPRHFSEFHQSQELHRQRQREMTAAAHPRVQTAGERHEWYRHAGMPTPFLPPHAFHSGRQPPSTVKSDVNGHSPMSPVPPLPESGLDMSRYAHMDAREAAQQAWNDAMASRTSADPAQRGGSKPSEPYRAGRSQWQDETGSTLVSPPSLIAQEDPSGRTRPDQLSLTRIGDPAVQCPMWCRRTVGLRTENST
jgi:hypothetical protein